MKTLPFSARLFPVIRSNSKSLLVLAALLLVSANTLLFAQGPTVSYSSPQTYTLGTTVTLTPTSSNVAALGFSTSTALVSSGFPISPGIAIDASYNIYVANTASNTLEKIAPGGSPVSIGSVTAPVGLAVDKSGNIYLSNSFNGTVVKFPPGGGTAVTIGTGFSQPAGIAVDGAGNVYVAIASNGTVQEIPAGGGGVITVGTGFKGPEAVAVDAAGNIYVADTGNNAIKMIPVAGGPVITLATGFNEPYGIVVDFSGNVYVSDSNNNLVKMLPGGTGTPITLGSGFKFPEGLAVDPGGNVYIGDLNNNAVKQVSPAGGYFLGTALPAGLSFSNTTGVISGTPVAASAATNYPVSAYSSNGGAATDVNIATVPPALPTISYSSPQTYTAGVAITPLAPAASGVAAAGYSGFTKTIGSGFSMSYGIALDAAGNVYVGDLATNTIEKFPAGGGAMVPVATFTSAINGLAVDAAGNIYESGGNSTVVKIPAGSSTPMTIASGFVNAAGLAVDAAGNLYVVDTGNDDIERIPAGGGSDLFYSAGLNGPTAVAVDAAGNIYVADTGDNAIKEFTAGNFNSITLGSGFSAPSGIAVDVNGNLFIGDSGNNAIKMIPAGSNTPVIISSGFINPRGIAINAYGQLYVSDAGNSAVKQIAPVGGYYISATLPQGLSFSNATGIISGTPTVTSPATNYTITGYNYGGGTTATVSIKTVNPPAVTISYAGPQTYTAGTAITPLSPASSNVSAQGYSGNTTVMSSGFGISPGVAVDASGNIYVGNNGANVIEKIPAGGGTPVTFASFAGPEGVAVDAAGNVYVSGNMSNEVQEFPVGGGSPITLATQISGVNGIAVDAAGNVYAASSGPGTIVEILAGGGGMVTLGSGFSNPEGVAVDAAGNVYVADANNNAIKMISFEGGPIITLGSGFSGPYGVAVDAAGNVYVADSNNNGVKVIPAGNGAVLTAGTNFNSPRGVAVDASGKIYVTDVNHSEVKQVLPVGGYYLNTALPQGLSISSATGVVSGTPAAASAAKNYTVTAYNIGGSNAATVSIKTVLPALPTLSYASPQVYTSGTTISPLNPVSSGVAPISYGVNASTVGSAFTISPGVAADATGNVYIGDETNNVIEKLPAGGGAMVPVATVTAPITGIAVDAAGNIYESGGSNTVVKIAAGSSTPVTIASGFVKVGGLAVDAAGNLYIVDTGNDFVEKIPAGGGSNLDYSAGLNAPTAVAVDALGNIYVADTGNNAVKEFTAGNFSATTLGSGFSAPSGIAVDAAGNVYVGDSGNNAIKGIPGGVGTPVLIGSGFLTPKGVAIDNTGKVYASDAGHNIVKEVSPIGGYFISATLPQGLNFSNTTGSINGMPTAVSLATNYIVSAYNSGGQVQATVNIKTVNPPAVTISYASPQTYTSGVAITPLSPTSSNVSAQGYSGNTTVMSSGFGVSPGVAVDAAGNIYVGNNGANVIEKIPAGGGTPVTFASFAGPEGVAVDAAGNVYVSGNMSNEVQEFPVGGGSPITLATQISGVNGIAVDAAGNVYAASSGSSTIVEILAGGGGTVTVGSGFANPEGVAVDAYGNVYVADANNNAIKMIPAAGGPIVTLGSGFNGPYGVAVDAAGNVYVADSNNNAVKVIPAGGGTILTAGSNFYRPEGVAVDAAGKVYVTDANHSEVKQVLPVGGYYLNTALPQGLSLSSATGVISGTPAVASAAKNYTVTAYNIGGSSAAVVNITVASKPSVATLSALKLSAGTLSPVFATATTSYSSNVGNGVTSITVTPTATDPLATIMVNGKAVAQGATSAPIALNVGTNAINVVVTAQDGVTTDTYAITMTRAPSSNAYLLYFSVQTATVSPTFAYKTFSYTANVPNTTTSVTVTPSLLDTTATAKVNGTLVANKTASTPISLAVGVNTITVLVTAQDGVTTQTYTITIGRGSSVSTLSAMKISAGTLTPAFATGTTSYTASVGNGITSITVTPTTSDPTATVKVNGTTVASGTASGAIALSVGSNTITTVVTAQNGTTTKTYTTTVTRAPSNNAYLLYLSAQTATLSPGFAYKTFSYSASVPNATTSVTVTPSLLDLTATVKVNGTTVANKTASGPIALNAGANTITILVTAQDGVTTQTYTIVITRAPSTNDNLSAMKISAGTLTPTFATGTTSYTASVGNGITSLTVTPTTADPTATIKVNGTAVTSGTASGAIALNVGSNVITTIVTAQNGTSTKTYTVTVTRAPSSNAYLLYLSVQTATLSPGFAYKTFAYTSNVPNATSSVTVTPSVLDLTATVKVNGTTVANKTASGPIALAVGANTITVLVTAQDGTTTQTYTVTITRAAGGADSYVPVAIGTQISVTKPTETVALTGDGIMVHQGVSPNGDGINDFLQIDNISQYPDNKLMIMNRNGQLIYETQGYDNASKVFDGHSNKNGQMQMPGTYFYQLDYTTNGITKHKTGFLVLKY